jgi:hypothetical protein
MVTFTINIPPTLVYIPYMDPMGYIFVHKNLGGSYQPNSQEAGAQFLRPLEASKNVVENTGNSQILRVEWEYDDVFLSQGDIMLTYFNTIIANNML